MQALRAPDPIAKLAVMVMWFNKQIFNSGHLRVSTTLRHGVAEKNAETRSMHHRRTILRNENA